MSELTYKQNMSAREMSKQLWAIGLPVSILLFAFITILRFGRFGENLILPMTSAMWLFGAVCGLILPSHRKNIVSETHWTIAGYLAGLNGVKEIIRLVSGTTTQMLMATYDQAMPAASNASLSGFMEYLLWILTVMVPIGFLVMQGKKIMMFRRKASKERFFDQIRGIRKSEEGRR